MISVPCPKCIYGLSDKGWDDIRTGRRWWNMRWVEGNIDWEPDQVGLTKTRDERSSRFRMDRQE